MDLLLSLFLVIAMADSSVLRDLGNSSLCRFAAEASDKINGAIIGRDLSKNLFEVIFGTRDAGGFFKVFWNEDRAFFVLLCVLIFLSFLYLCIIIPFVLYSLFKKKAFKPKRYWKRSILPFSVTAVTFLFISLLGIIICLGANASFNDYIQKLPNLTYKTVSELKKFYPRNPSIIVKAYDEKFNALKTELDNVIGSADRRIIDNLDENVHKAISGTFMFKNFTARLAAEPTYVKKMRNIAKIEKYRSWTFFAFLLLYVIMVVLMIIGTFKIRSLLSVAVSFLAILMFILSLYNILNYSLVSVLASACHHANDSASFYNNAPISNILDDTWDILFSTCSDHKNTVFHFFYNLNQNNIENELLQNFRFYNQSSSSKDRVQLIEKHLTGLGVYYNLKTRHFELHHNALAALAQNDIITKNTGSNQEKLLKEYMYGFDINDLDNLLQCKNLSKSFEDFYSGSCGTGYNALSAMNTGLFTILIFTTLALLLAPSIARRLRKRTMIYNPKEDL